MIQMTNILLSGANGYMGRTVTRVCQENDKVKIVAGYDINTAQNGGFPVYSDLSELDGLGEEIHAIIDFSHPALFDSLLDYAVRTKTPAVFCTTGLSERASFGNEKGSRNKPHILFRQHVSGHQSFD